MVRFTNPVLLGFNPDPSVCLVNRCYFAVTSSFHCWPCIPIYISTNLVDWKQIGNVITEKKQGIELSTLGLNISQDGGKHVHISGIYAPTIRYNNGKFYVISTNLVPTEKGGFKPRNFICHTEDIWNGKWSKAHYMDYFYAIDPSLYFHDNGKCYSQGAYIYGYDKPITNSIYQFEVNPDNGEKLSDMYEICPGFTRITSEGPHVYKRQNWYYLVFAEGGTFNNHMLCVARSNRIEGPFEPFKDNPIATNRDKPNEYVQWVGHGELFQDSEDHWWAMVLATRNGNNDCHPLSRESFLTPVYWKDDWPITQTVKVDMEVEVHLPNSTHDVNQLVPQWFQHDIFQKYLFIGVPDFKKYLYNHERDEITIKSGANELDNYTGPISFIGQRQPDLKSQYQVKVEFDIINFNKSAKAGICVYKDPKRHYQLGIDFSTCKVYVISHTLKGVSYVAEASINSSQIDSSQCITFKIESTEDNYNFYFKQETWCLLATLSSRHLCALEFTGTLYGKYVYGDVCALFTETDNNK